MKIMLLCINYMSGEHNDHLIYNFNGRSKNLLEVLSQTFKKVFSLCNAVIP